MCNKIWAIAKINLKNIKTPYFVTGLIFAIIFVQSIIYVIIATAGGSVGDQLQISSGNYLWLLVIMAAIFIPTKNFRRIANLGGKREHFFWGSLACYAVLAGAVSIINTVFFHTYERFLINTGHYIGFETFMQNTALMEDYYVTVSVTEVFGWIGNGVVIGLLQQLAFLFLVAVVVHTLTAMQDKWYGWAVDVVIAAILAVFIPIAPLRAWLLKFFDLIIFNTNPFMQITVCMILAVAVYMLNKPILARKTI